MPSGRRATQLQRLADETLGAFAEQILPFDAAAAARYGPLVGERERAGRLIAALDAQIAAICVAHRATLATRNPLAGFADVGVELVDPSVRLPD
ncbi:PIN domain-containing protein [Solirubrobacter deserti]|uniref:Type II toxin-antitoxin system VapC family toxin n=1 Tax=Solirubrobacter deserti TaxID=2282478 RepID=A0ABT4RK98_9ACTN|nr:hypothetical protein [Solirubrobacter deserti]MDA0138974.1 hypothetical protein [Solirubrobacter deserti]